MYLETIKRPIVIFVSVCHKIKKNISLGFNWRIFFGVKIFWPLPIFTERIISYLSIICQILVSILPAKKKSISIQRVSFICHLNFLLLGRSQIVYIRALLSNLLLEGKKCICCHLQNRLSKEMGARMCLVGAQWEGERGCQGRSPGIWGSCDGAGRWHILLLGCLSPSPHSGKAAVAARGRALSHRIPYLQRLEGLLQAQSCSEGKAWWGLPSLPL